MGYYDLEWKNLPVHHNLTKTIPSLASLTHNILIFPIFYQRRKIESFDFAQKAHQGKKDTKSLESFLVNCLVITVSTLGMLNSWLIMMPYVLLHIVKSTCLILIVKFLLQSWFCKYFKIPCMFERLCPSVWFSASFCWTFFRLYLEETLVNGSRKCEWSTQLGQEN